MYARVKRTFQNLVCEKISKEVLPDETLTVAGMHTDASTVCGGGKSLRVFKVEESSSRILAFAQCGKCCNQKGCQ